MSQKTETMSLRLRPEEKEQLHKLSQRIDRPAGWVLRELLKAACEDQRIDITAAGIAVK